MILICSSVFPPEPVVSANLSFDIADKLANKDKVVVLSPKSSRPFGFNYLGVGDKYNNFTHVILNSYTCPKSKILGRIKESYSLGRHIYKYINDHNEEISVIYANTWPLFSQFFVIKGALKFKIPILLHIQDIYPESISSKMPKFIGKIINKLFLPLDRYILQNSDLIITISSNMKDYLINSRKLNSNKISIVRNWQNDEIFANHKNKNSNIFTFMYLGSINPSAGVDLLIKAFNIAKLENSKLIIAGNGSDKERCVELSNKLNNSNIEFCDAPKSQVGKLQNLADVLLLPLKKGIGRTASPSKLTAYLLSAKPVIASVDEDSDVAKIINSSNCGFVIASEDIDKLVNVMTQTQLMSKSSLELLGINGKNFAKKYLSKKVNLNKISSLILNYSK